MMKRALLFATVFVLCFSLVACNNSASPDPDPSNGTDGDGIAPPAPITIEITSSDGNVVYTVYFSDGIYNYTELAVKFENAETAQAVFESDFEDDETAGLDGDTIYRAVTFSDLVGLGPEDVLAYWDDKVENDPAFSGYTVVLTDGAD